MLSSPTWAATPGWMSQPDSMRAAEATTTGTNARTFFTGTPSLLRIDHGVDDRPRPFKQSHSLERSASPPRSARTGHQERLDGRLDDALGVEPLQSYDAGVGQRDGREAHVAAGGGDLADAGLAGPGAEARDQEQCRHDGRRLAVAVVELLGHRVD